MSVLMLAALVAPASLLSAKAEQSPVHVEGLLDCGSWLDLRQHNRSEGVEGYVTGFLNGLAVGHHREFWFAGQGKITREQVFYWTDDYCRRNPLKDVIEGLITLFDSRAH